MKKTISLILVCVILMVGTWVMAKAENKAAIGYRFDNGKAGYAQGEVTFSAASAGDYSLWWADDAAALDGWFPITEFSLAAGETGSYTFAERVAIPADATKLIAVGSALAPTVANAAAVYTIPASKRLPYTSDQRDYRFAALSDIHIDVQDGGKNVYYTNAADNFARALSVCDSRGADFIISAGDQVTNASGATLEWLEYQRIIADSPYQNPIYEAIGNHEMRYAKYSECGVACGIEEFIINTGLDGSAQSMTARKPYYEVTEPSTGDHFIFMALEYGADPSEYDEFSDEQMAWAEGLLSRYSGDGHRIFLIQHSSISGYGAGDNHDDPAYGGSMNTSFKNNKRFQTLIETYRDVIWFSGHTHVDFADNVNFSDEGGASCLMFHIPSVANTTRLSRDSEGNSEMDRTFYEDTTQGYLVDVYDGAAIIGGVNFYHDKFYPAYTYIVGDTPESVPTEPTTAPTDLPTEPATDEPDPIPFVWGDANRNGMLEILDVTAIQRHLASLEELSEQGMKAAMVCGNDELSILDATAIQRRLADLIDTFPVETSLAPTGASTALTAAKAELSAYYQYASYPEYAALKRACADSDASAAETALDSFRTLRQRVKLTTVYYTDVQKTGNIHAYVWKDSNGRYIDAWPGQKPTYVKTNSYGQDVFALTVDTARYDRVVFSDGGDRKTVDIPLTDQSGRIYYPITSDSPYQVTYGVYDKRWYDDPDATATVYFTNTEGWNKVYIYAWTTASGTWPGTPMTYVRKSSSGKSIYKATVPKNAKVIFTDGSEQTVDIPAIADGFGYYPCQKNSDQKWQVVEYRY